MKKLTKKIMSFAVAVMVLCTMPGLSAVAEETSVTMTDAEVVSSDAVEDTIVTDEEQNDDSAAIEEEYSISGAVFDDVNETDWFCPSVTFVLNKGIMTGMGNNLFAPSNELTRAQFATIIYRISGSPEVDYVEKFSDVIDGKFYSAAVSWASQEEVAIIEGYTTGEFRPNNPITREEMATLLYRYAVYNGFIEVPEEDTDGSGEAEQEGEVTEPEQEDEVTESEQEGEVTESEQEGEVTEPEQEEAENDPLGVLAGFPDGELVSTYAIDTMKWVVENAIVIGDNNGNLNPQGYASRAAAATMLQRFYDIYMYGQLENIEILASCGSVTAEIVDKNKGTFKITVTDPQATTEITKIETAVYSKNDKSDQHIYTMALQSDGTYQTTASVRYHDCNFGTYTVEARVMLSNGVRLTVASTTIVVEGTLASCDSLTAKMVDSNIGTFKITVTNPQSVLDIKGIRAVAYSKADKSNKVIYTMARQSDGSYQATASAKKHGYSFGTYTIEAEAVLSDGTTVTMEKITFNVAGKESRARIYEYVYQVYNQVGRDLNKCYWWVVNNTSYQTLQIHVTPPAGYTRCENYALYGFQNKKGNCYVYAAMFYYLAEGLGYNAQYIEGQVGMAAGGYGPHGWVAINSNGTTYICDPEAQDEPNLSRYNFYMQLKSRPVLRYVWP